MTYWRPMWQSMCCLCAHCLVVKLQLTTLYLGPNPLAVKSEAETLSKQALLATTAECRSRAAPWWSPAIETKGFRVNVVYRTIISLGYSTLPKLRLVQSPETQLAYPFHMNTPCHWKQDRCMSLFWNPCTDLISNSKVQAHSYHNIRCDLHVS